MGKKLGKTLVLGWGILRGGRCRGGGIGADGSLLGESTRRIPNVRIPSKEGEKKEGRSETLPKCRCPFDPLVVHKTICVFLARRAPVDVGRRWA